jgi:hypothetical protein
MGAAVVIAGWPTALPPNATAAAKTPAVKASGK